MPSDTEIFNEAARRTGEAAFAEAHGSAAVACAPTPADAEMWRELIKPVVIEMHKRGLNKFTIYKTGPKVDIAAW